MKFLLSFISVMFLLTSSVEAKGGGAAIGKIAIELGKVIAKNAHKSGKVISKSKPEKWIFNGRNCFNKPDADDCKRGK
jgi:hypothetical protein